MVTEIVRLSMAGSMNRLCSRFSPSSSERTCPMGTAFARTETWSWSRRVSEPAQAASASNTGVTTKIALTNVLARKNMKPPLDLRMRRG